MPAAYTGARAYVVLFVRVLVLFLFGFHGYTLAISALAGWAPALFLDAKLGRAIFPPMIRVEEEIDSRSVSEISSLYC